MDECIEFLKDARGFATLVENAEYCHVKVARSKKNKNAFVTHGVNRYMRMRTSLVNAHTTLQKAVDVILLSVKFQKATVYLENITVFPNGAQPLSREVKQVLRRLMKEEWRWS